MVTHASPLAWETPCTEEPGGSSPGVANSKTRLSDGHPDPHRRTAISWTLSQALLPSAAPEENVSSTSAVYRLGFAVWYLTSLSHTFMKRYIQSV